MTAASISQFVHSMTYEDIPITYDGRLFWCLGLSWNEQKKRHYMMVVEADPKTHEGVGTLFYCESASKDECMRHFLEDKYWDGKSFHEIAHELEWADL